MPFLDAAHFEQLDKQEERDRRIQAKKETNQINDEANGNNNKKGLNTQDQLRLLKKDFQRDISKAPKPKQISIRDIERELKLNDLIEDRKAQQIEELLNETETMEIKNEIIDVLSIPHTHPDKNKIFKFKLQQSDTINNYVNDNILFRFFNKANGHFKFGAMYTIKYLQTHKEYAAYIKQVEQIKHAENEAQKKRAENEAQEKHAENGAQKNAPKKRTKKLSFFF